MIFAIVFILGMLAGAVVLATTILYQAQKIKRKLDFIDKAALDTEIANKVRRMFAEIHEITEEQMILMPYIESPSANASHSHHKNETIRKIKSLEERKIELFRSILDIGIDPTITMFVDGESKQVKMSEALRIQDLDSTPSENTDSKSSHRDVRPLTLVKNEENNNDTGDPKVP